MATWGVWMHPRPDLICLYYLYYLVTDECVRYTSFTTLGERVSNPWRYPLTLYLVC